MKYITLTSSNISQLMLEQCRLEDIKLWESEIDYDNGGSEEIITRIIDGVKYKVRESDPYVCFFGAEIVAKLWKSRNPSSFTIVPEMDSINGIALEQIEYLYGVYYFDMNTTNESHGFVLYMTLDEITVYNSYGGNVGFYITRFDRNSWLSLFISFWTWPLKDQIENYHLLWGFNKNTKYLPKHNPNGRTISIRNIRYFKVY